MEMLTGQKVKVGHWLSLCLELGPVGHQAPPVGAEAPENANPPVRGTLPFLDPALSQPLRDATC